jgi:hypothetical protein
MTQTKQEAMDIHDPAAAIGNTRTGGGGGVGAAAAAGGMMAEGRV